MTLQADDAWDLAERAEREGTVFLVPYGWNYKAFTVAAKRMLETGGSARSSTPSATWRRPRAASSAATRPTCSQRWNSDTAPDPGHVVSARARRRLRPRPGHALERPAVLAHRAARGDRGGAGVDAGAPVDLFDAGVIRFDNGALGSLSGAATLPDGEQVSGRHPPLRHRGRAAARRRARAGSLSSYDGERRGGDRLPGAGEYECIVPPARFIELITGASTENNSDVTVAARSVELIEALLRSSAADGAEIRVHA